MKSRIVLPCLLAVCLLLSASLARGAGDAEQGESDWPDSATINVTFEGEWEPEAQQAVEYAAEIWSQHIFSPVPIEVEARWSSTWGGDLVSVYGVWTRSYKLPNPNASYPQALANVFAEYPASGINFTLAFNVDLDNWYFGTDGATPAEDYDMATVALKGLARGFGMRTSMSLCGEFWQYGCWGAEDYPPYHPYIYDTFLVNGAGELLVDTDLFANPSEELHDELTSGDIYFDGPKARAVNGGVRPRLDAPGDWTSIRYPLYLDEETYPRGSAHALMTPVLEPGEVIHEPGPLTVAMLHDLGWRPIPDPIIIDPIPDIFLQANTPAPNAVDLWQYIVEPSTPEELTYRLTSVPSYGVTVTFDGRYLSFEPYQGFSGEASAIVEVENDTQAVVKVGLQIYVVADRPNLGPFPDLLIPPNTLTEKAVDLWDYVADGDTPPEAMTFRVKYISYPQVGLIFDGRYLSFEPESGWTGHSVIEIEVTDDAGQIDIENLYVEVEAQGPAFEPIPDVVLPRNGSLAQPIDLWEYASDPDTPQEALTFELYHMTPPEIGATLDGHYLSFTPENGWVGQGSVTVEVMDDAGLTASMKVTVKVEAEPPVLLPIPDLTLPANTLSANALDVWPFLANRDRQNETVAFFITNVSAPEVGLSFDGRYLSFDPVENWTGASEMTLEVVNDASQEDSSTFTVYIEAQPAVLLPLLMD